MATKMRMISHCSYCDKKFEHFSHVRKKYCSEKCHENAKTERRSFRRNLGLTIDRETTEPEPAETVNIRGYDLAPEHAKRMEEVVRQKEADRWV